MNTSTDPAFQSTVLTNSTSLLHIATLDLNSTNPNFDLLPTQQNWEAGQCTLSFCAKVYSDAKVINGRLDLGSPTEFELVVDDRSYNPDPYALGRFTVPENVSSFTGNREFYIGSDSAGQLSHLLSEFFKPSMLYSGGAIIDSSTVVASTLHTAGNVSAALADEATSLTNATRTLSNSTEVRGQTFTLDQYIIVNWAWISLLVATCLLAVTVLIASILLSEQDKGSLWKGSALALLFHGFESSGGAQLQGDVDTVEDMDVAAKSVRAELKKVDGMKFFMT